MTELVEVTQGDRFWSFVQRGEPQECWLWTGTRTASGYGMLSTKKATHIALEISGRPRPARALALHSCDNPPCCNPTHLRWGTPADNVADMIERRRHRALRKTECSKGHPLSGENLILRNRGHRGCRTCQREFHQSYKRKPEVQAKYNEHRRELRAQNGAKPRRRSNEQVR